MSLLLKWNSYTGCSEYELNKNQNYRSSGDGKLDIGEEHEENISMYLQKGSKK